MTTPSLTPAKAQAIARNLYHHGVGPANVKRTADLFHISEASMAGAIAAANTVQAPANVEAAAAPTVTSAAAIPAGAPTNAALSPKADVDPVRLARAQDFQLAVNTASEKPLASASIHDLENLIAARYGR